MSRGAHTSQQRTHPLGEKKSTMAALPGGLPDNLTTAARVGRDAQTGHPTVFPPPTLHPQILQTLTLGPLSTPISSRPFFSTPHSLNPAQSLAPKGLHLQHAHIKGPLDFPHALLTASLHREGCLFPEQATFADARVAPPLPYPAAGCKTTCAPPSFAFTAPSTSSTQKSSENSTLPTPQSALISTSKEQPHPFSPQTPSFPSHPRPATAPRTPFAPLAPPTTPGLTVSKLKAG